MERQNSCLVTEEQRKKKNNKKSKMKEATQRKHFKGSHEKENQRCQLWSHFLSLFPKTNKYESKKDYSVEKAKTNQQKRECWSQKLELF